MPNVREVNSATFSVCVVVLTKERPNTFSAALSSIAGQDYEGNIEVLAIGDDCEYLASVEDQEWVACSKVQWLNVSGSLVSRCPPIERISRLRMIAVGQTSSRWITFLDDDNSWDTNHLSSLITTQIETGCLAVHSWRRFVNDKGHPLAPITFPWLNDLDKARDRFSIVAKLGILSSDSDVVRDRSSAVFEGVDYGMVDCGEWLLSTSLLQTIGFRTSYSELELEHMVGEDDKLLEELRVQGVPIACTSMATLRYRVGGMSNENTAGRFALLPSSCNSES